MNPPSNLRSADRARVQLTARSESLEIPDGERLHAVEMRLHWVGGFIFLILLTAWARAFQLAFYPDPRLTELVRRQYQSVVSLSASRGAILDRGERELAVSIQVDSLYADPREIENPKEVAPRLARALGKPVSRVRKLLTGDKAFVWVERWCEPSVVRAVKALNIPGLRFLKESKRFYPNRQLAAHLIGFAGLDAEGLSGIEFQYNDRLKELPRRVIMDRDGAGRMIVRDVNSGALSSSSVDLILTLDSRLQHDVQAILERALKESGARRATAIVMNPETGEILALDNQPSFNLNTFRSVDPERTRNWAVTDALDPGSLLKVMVVAGAFEKTHLTPNSHVDGEDGLLRLGNVTVRESEYRKFGRLSIRDVIRVSSNIGSVKVAQLLGRERLHRTLTDLGFGRRTMIDLPGENAGLLRESALWNEVDLANIAFGQGISATPIQVITALSILANGGVPVRPHVVKAERTRGGGRKARSPDEARSRVISAKTWEKLIDVMTSVTGPEGTAPKARIEGISVAGKTGTAQKLVNGRYTSDVLTVSFFGFLPAEDPKLAVLVMLDEPRLPASGGSTAAPVFREIAESAIRFGYLTVDPVATASPARSDIALIDYAEEKRTRALLSELEDRLKKGDPLSSLDFKGLSLMNVLTLAHRHGFQVRSSGSGYVVAQEYRKKGPRTEVVLYLGHSPSVSP